MDADTMRRRVAEARVGRLATVTAGGRPHVVPCCFALDEGGDGGRPDVLYSAVDAKPKSTTALRRLANVRANGAASLLVDLYDEDWSELWWVRVDGRAAVLESGDRWDRALDLLAAKYPQYRRQRPAGPVMAVEVTGWRAWP